MAGAAVVAYGEGVPGGNAASIQRLEGCQTSFRQLSGIDGGRDLQPGLPNHWRAGQVDCIGSPCESVRPEGAARASSRIAKP